MDRTGQAPGLTPLWLALEIWVGGQPGNFQDSEPTRGGVYSHVLLATMSHNWPARSEHPACSVVDAH